MINDFNIPTINISSVDFVLEQQGSSFYLMMVISDERLLKLIHNIRKTIPRSVESYIPDRPYIPHITILSGINKDYGILKKIKKLLEDDLKNVKKIPIKLEYAYFKPNILILKVEDNNFLQQIRDIIKNNISNKDIRDEFIPHITIKYLKTRLNNRKLPSIPDTSFSISKKDLKVTYKTKQYNIF